MLHAFVPICCEGLVSTLHDMGRVAYRSKIPALLSKLRLSCGDVQVEGTPRRLAVMVSQLALQQRESRDRLRGPPAKVCCVLCCAMLCCPVLWCAALCHAVLCCSVVWCAVLRCAMPCPAVLYILCCAVLC